MTASLLAAVLALALLTVLPGPDVAIVTRVALAGGRRAALSAALGIVAGLLVWGIGTVAGLTALLAASATAYMVVKYVGAAYLVWLGLSALWRSRANAVEDATTERPALRRPWRAGLLTNLLNPKIAVFYTGLLPQLVPPGLPHTPTLLALVVVHAALSLGWLALCAGVVSGAAALTQRPGVRRALERVTGLVLIGFGVRVALAGNAEG